MREPDYELLSGGNVANQVVRVGTTVRKPSTSATSSVEAFLQHLYKQGFTGAPHSLGRDEQGRHALAWVVWFEISTMPHRALCLLPQLTGM